MKNNKKYMNAKVIVYIAMLILLLVTVFGVAKMTGNSIDKMTKVKLETNHGDIIINLYSDMPITTSNFKNLAEKGTYDNVIFHRIIDGFMIQGGDPTGTGFGDPSIPNIKDEFTHIGGNKNNKYTISMANAGPNTGSSQFFINLVDNNFLDDKHPAFGLVVEGEEVIEKIAKVQKDARDKPLENIVILKATVLE
jgi:cyclophilin family peptidyl-prolyl cis-trans isomerase